MRARAQIMSSVTDLGEQLPNHKVSLAIEVFFQYVNLNISDVGNLKMTNICHLTSIYS